MSNSELEREQEYVAMLYRRVDELREHASKRLAGVLREDGGTRQARVERESAFARYTERVARLDAAENGLCFGRLDLRTGERRYIGRIGILDDSDEGDPLLVDWRAPAARPFYVATAAAPEGVRRRRHIATRRRRVVDLDDEVLDGEALDAAGEEGLIGEAALLAAVNAGRTGRMRDIVETLQAEQDEIIRSDHRGVLVVQGGPGTGKTAVALHRAAYLLYTHRNLAERGVLVVGPNATFLRYIGQVLPGLGETNVLLSTVGGLFPGVEARRAEPPAAAEVKGRALMAGVVAAAVRDRQAPPRGPVEIPYGDGTLRLEEEDYRRAAVSALSGRVLHNEARRIFVREILDVLTRQAAERIEAVVLDDGGRPLDGGDGRGVLGDADVRALLAAGYPRDLLDADHLLDAGEDARPLLDESDLAELRTELATGTGVRAALDKMWPSLTPQRLLEDLFADPLRLASAAPGLTDAERESLLRAPGGGWTPADVPLLDEAAELLGADDRAVGAQATARARAAAERREQIAYARGVLDIAFGSRSSDLEEGEEAEILTAADLLGEEELAERQEIATHRTVAERAAADRTWTFGHVIVDEAQEVSAMAWRLLMRRCPSRSMTIVGDVAQTGDAAGASSWESALRPHVGDRWRLAQLTVNYRTPAEIMAVAADLLAALDPGLRPPRSVRETGVPPWRLSTTPADLPRILAECAAREAAALEDGRLAIIVPETRLTELAAAVPEAAHGSDPDLERPVVMLTVRQAKGLEFDSVLIADPAAILADSPRGRNDLYVALTRATQRLGILHPGPPPAELSRPSVPEAGTERA
ncbi:HelD family protein [Actinoallomurus soli]|uniref:HelD family protein n=1 Tax=Actinoallomurus soli TaxID=2952535 RepID=UPI002093D1EB|nr:UvrD-helicase domain-containing protein [Actinoallomurus soli]MCO5969573.1 AAA family ATPase [Actinoallomurus soli]